MLRRLVLITCFVSTALWGTPAGAQTGTGGTVLVQVTREGTPLEGAFVALVGSGTNRYGAITATTGIATFTSVAADVYTARASAPGTAVGTQANIVVSDGGSTTAAVAVTASGTIFSGLSAYGSQTSAIVADGRTGVFYLNNSSIPSLYRTGDYGGTWAPVTITSDDPGNGIDGNELVGLLATSGYPGEIVAATRSKVWYSRDFGVTWASIALPTLNGPPGPNGAPPATLHWTHPRTAGAPSRIFLVATETTDIYYLELNTFFPAWTQMSNSYRQAVGDKVAFADGPLSSFAAVVPAAGGSVTIYRIGATPDRTTDATDALTVAGAAPAGAPQSVHFGGRLTGPAFGSGGSSPNALLVYSRTATTPTSPPQSGNGAAVMTTYVSGSWVSSSATDFRNEQNDNPQTGPVAYNTHDPNSCHATDIATGSIAPVEGFGTIGRCWLEQSGTALIVRPVSNIRNTSGFVYDAEYGSANGNRVVLAGDSANMGAAKADRLNPTLTRPDFPTWPTVAVGGFTAPPYATTTGGISLTGLNAAVVGDVVFSPTSASHMALVMTGGGRTVGSRDGGRNWFTLEARGGHGGGAIDWWPTTDGAEWLVVGLGAGTEDGNMLSAVRLANAGAFVDTTFTTPVSGTRKGDLGLSDRVGILAVAGIPGTDKAVIAAARNDHTAATLTLVSLTQSGSSYLAAATSLGVSFGAGNEPRALTYCPASGSAASVADTLFVAVSASTETGTDGTLLSISSPAGASPGAPVILAGATGANFRDVRVDCASGTVYAGRWTSSPASGLMKATTTAGVLGTLTAVTTLPARPDAHAVETLDISPANVARVIVVSRSGDVYSTSDGGATFSVLNDTSTASCSTGGTRCGRKFGAAPAGDIEITPPAAAADWTITGDACPGGVCIGEALFGSSAGVYATLVSLEPGAPTNFSATASGFTITMTWSAATGGGQASEYLLEAALDGAFEQLVYGPVPISTTTSAVLNAPPGAIGTFFVRVRARNVNGTGAASNIVAVTLPGAAAVPGIPGTPTVVVNADGTVAVTWLPPSSGATPTGYRVYLDTPSGPFPGTPVTLPAITSVASPFPLPASSYVLRVSALTSAAEGTPSEPAAFTIAGCIPPSDPTGFTITRLGGVNARLAWTAAAGATSYHVQASLDAAFTAVVLDANVGATTVIDATGVPGTFHVRIVGRNGCGVSTPSNVAIVTLP